MAIYLDFNATTPVDRRVAEVVQHFMTEEFGNAGSRTHGYGQRAKKAVEDARRNIAGRIAGATPEDVVFTSGATEANNLAILGLGKWLAETERLHVVSTAVEHKAVLEPLQQLKNRYGVKIDLVKPDSSGAVKPEQIAQVLRHETALVSVMHVNNETGAVQPLAEIADLLSDHPAYLHVDAAQGFGKINHSYHERIDMLSISGHKLFSPKGIGALVLRRRDGNHPPLRPLMFGGGQERGLRPGTLAVPLIAGFGKAVELAFSEFAERQAKIESIRKAFFHGTADIPYLINGSPELCVHHTVNVSMPGLDSEAAILMLKPIAAISNGAACTSTTYSVSHVLQAMGLSADRVRSALRISWSHVTTVEDIEELIRGLRRAARQVL